MGTIKAISFWEKGKEREKSNTGEDMEEAVKESSVVQKKLQRLSRNMSGAIALLKNLLNLDSASDSATALFGKIESSRKLVWGSVARSRDICASLWAYWTRRERRYCHSDVY